MPRLFPDHLTLDGVQQQVMLLQQGPHSATPANAVHFPNSKGIYFWYMRPEGYGQLSQHIAFPQPLIGPTTDQHGNHLVYVGTAGTRKTKDNRKGIGDRYLWHVRNKHSISQVCSNALSTLRQTLGALLANDLIETEGVSTEVLVDRFMAKYLSVAYIAYEGDLAQIGLNIDDDEKILIKALKPLLNLRSNPNIKISGHPSRLIKARGLVVKRSTKLRIRCP